MHWFARGFADLSHDQQQLILYIRQPNSFEIAFGDETQIMFIDYLSAAVGSSTSEDWLGMASDHMSKSSHEQYVDYVM